MNPTPPNLVMPDLIRQPASSSNKATKGSGTPDQVRGDVELLLNRQPIMEIED